MLRLLPALVLLGVLVTPEGTSKTCPACASPGHCRDILCPSAQDSCLLSQMQLENGTVVDSGSCVAPGRCRESITTLTYGPNSTLWVSTACCANSCSITGPPQEPGPEANHVTCQYCSGNKSAPCDSLSVMNCTGNQTKCVTLNGTWSGGNPQILKGCATPDVCHLRVNDTLGPEASGFRLTSQPGCNPSPTQPGALLEGPHAAVTHTNPKPTICFTCSDLQHCDPLPCPEDRNYCLQTAGITAFGDGNSFSWRNGSCVASTDCTLSNSISGLTYGIGLGFWVNTTCCQGNCQEPTRLATLPASRTLTKFLCPTCPKDQSGSCRSSFYLQCPRGETQCVQLDLTLDEGGQNVSMRGCGSRDLCSSRAVTEKLRTLSDLSGLRRLRLSRRPNCNPSRRAVLENQCLSSAAGGLRLALPLLAVALGAARLC
ncbi:CD177 antigen isoform X2 [Heterocephalus glaber]|nr:CD177 antigen isoform X2 [Heterocephalus glaber]